MSDITPISGLHSVLNRARQEIESATGYADILIAMTDARRVYDEAGRLGRLAKAKGVRDEIISSAHRLRADALEIETEATLRLAEEYDAAQQRGEIGQRGRPKTVSDGNGFEPASAADLGLSRKQIYEARKLRDVEAGDPGVVRRSLDEMLERGEEPTRAALRRAIEPPNSGTVVYFSPKRQAARAPDSGVEWGPIVQPPCDCDEADSEAYHKKHSAERIAYGLRIVGKFSDGYDREAFVSHIRRWDAKVMLKTIDFLIGVRPVLEQAAAQFEEEDNEADACD
jgi:hypothetical protein